MNATEINALQAGPEMDAAVAREVMGWTAHGNRAGHSAWVNAGGEHEVCECNFCPSDDMNDTKVVMDILKPTHWFSIKTGFAPGDPYVVKGGRHHVHSEAEAMGDSLEECICKVALMLKAKG